MTLRHIQTSIPGGKLPYFNHEATPLLVGTGDSRIAQGWWTTPTEWAPMARNALWWAEVISRRARTTSRHDQAVSGIMPSGLWARYAANTVNDWGFAAKDIPAGSVVVVLLGTNAVTGSTTFTGVRNEMAYYDRIVEYHLSRGHRPILICDLPRDGTNLTAAQVDWLCFIAEYIRRYRFSDYVELVDVWPDVADPTSTNCSPRSGIMQDDGLHLSNGCAYALGRKIAVALSNMGLPVIVDGVGTNADTYDATNNPWGCLNTNPMVTGTAGTVGTNATGTAPDSHGLSASTGLTVDGTATSTMQNGILRNCFKMVVTGIGAAGREVLLDRNIGLTQFALGDRIQAGVEFKIAANHVNLETPLCRFMNGASTAPSGFAGVYDVNSTPMNAVLTGEEIYGVVTTPPVVIGSIPGSATLRSGFLVGNDSISVSVEMKIFSHWLRKV